MRQCEGFHEIVEMLGEALFFLIDVEFLNVENHFLFQTRTVILGLRELCEIVHDAGADAFNALGFVAGHASQQGANVLDAYGEKLFKFGSFGATVLQQSVDGFIDGAHGSFEFFGCAGG